METPKLKSGDKVIPLGLLSTTAAMLCGAMNAGLVSWELKFPWWGIIVAAAVGGTIGSLIGKAIARMLYSGPGEQVAVVNVVPASIPKTLVASFLGAIAATVLLGFGPAAVLGALALVESIALISVIIMATVVVIMGVLAPLL